MEEVTFNGLMMVSNECKLLRLRKGTASAIGIIEKDFGGWLYLAIICSTRNDDHDY